MNSIRIRCLSVGQMQANCYLILDDQDDEVLIIDPGDDADYIMRIIEDERVKPVSIIATHGHFDHIMAAYELQAAYSIPFYITEKDLFLVERMRESAKHFLGVDPGPPPLVTDTLTPASTVSIGDNSLLIHDIPGHTPGHISLYNPQRHWALVGDLMFAGGKVGRTDFSYSSTVQLFESIKRILRLPGETIIYPGHGESTTVEIEQTYFQQSP